MNNSLAEVHPELVSEWSEKNLTLTPDDITFGSNKKVWWRGACGHEWQTSVKARSNGEKCPICSGARVIAGINDLATLEPLLVKQWSKKNKIKPIEVSIGSHKKVIWRCEKDFLGKNKVWRLFLCQCSGVFHSAGTKAWLGQLWRYPISGSRSEVLSVWASLYCRR